MECLEKLAPGFYAEGWDNVGLLTGREDKEVEKILLALDPSASVIEQACEWGADMLITHHPLIFSPMKSVTTKDFIGKLDLTDRFSGDVVYCYFRHERFLLPYFTVLLTETMLPFAPGMAPLTNRRFRSASTRTISRFCTVTFSLPM